MAWACCCRAPIASSRTQAAEASSGRAPLLTSSRARRSRLQHRLSVCAAAGPRGEPEQAPFVPLPPPPGYEQQQQPNTRFQDLSWRQFKERYLRANNNYLTIAFAFGFLTFGLRIGGANYAFDSEPFEFLATAASTGLMFAAVAWVLFDFTDAPPPGGNFSSPRK